MRECVRVHVKSLRLVVCLLAVLTLALALLTIAVSIYSLGDGEDRLFKWVGLAVVLAGCTSLAGTMASVASRKRQQ